MSLRLHIACVVAALGATGCPGTPGPVSGTPMQTHCENTTGTPSQIAFINRFSDRSLTVTWTDGDCKQAPVGDISAQNTLVLSTNSGDAFQVKDALTGEVLYDAKAPVGTTSIIFPSSDTQVCSAISSTPRKVGFKNRYADHAVSVFWVDAACREHAGGDIAPRDQLWVDSFVGHVFRVRQTAQQPIVGEFVVDAGTTPAVFSVPGDDAAPMCSDEGVTPSVVTITNHSANRVTAYWVDYKCHEIAVGDIAPNESIYQNTYYTHVFRVKDAAGTVLVSPPRIAAPTVTITVP